MRRQFLQWRMVNLTERILHQRLKLRYLYALKQEAELKLSGIVLAQQVQNYTQALEAQHDSDTSEREEGWRNI